MNAPASSTVEERGPNPAGSTLDVLERIRPSIEAAKVVSFDVFDTVLERPFARPTDLFAWIGEDVARAVESSSLDFRKERVEAEREARRRHAPAEDITLDAIYDVLRERLGLSESQATRVRELELAAERRVLAARPLGKALYDLARSLGKTVVFVSDMYLDAAFVSERLRAAGFEADRVFVSSETKTTKASGTMYEHVLRELAIAPGEMVHVGDNRRADVVSAEKRGIRAWHLPRDEESFERSRPLDRIRERFGAHDVGLGMMLTLGARGLARSEHRLPDDGSLFGGSAYRLGYLGMGPLLLGLARWLHRRSAEEGIDTLHFLARDGRVLKSAYEHVTAHVPGAPRATYLLCSRRAALVASLASVEDIFARVRHGFGTSTVAELLEGKFGLEAHEVPEDVWTKHGLSSDTVLRPRHHDAMRALLETLAPQLLDVARREREAYVQYLASLGCRGERNEAVVDIGYAGTMQIALDALTSGGRTLAGFYVVTLDTARVDVAQKGMRIDGYLGNFVDRSQMLHPFFRRVPLYETLFSSETTSLTKMVLVDGEPRPVFATEVEHEARRVEIVLEIQRGALDFVARMSRHAATGSVPLDLTPEQSLATLDSFFEHPDAIDAAIFRGVPFENAFGSARVLPILPAHGDSLEGACLWEEGRQALVHAGDARHGSWPTRVLASVVFRGVNALAPHVLAPSKATKLRYDPARFFADSRSPFIRRLGRLYLSVPSRR